MTSAAATFRALQRGLHPLPAHESLDSPAQTILVLPSLDLDPHTFVGHPTEMPAMEERFLFLLFLLQRGDVRIVFATSLPVDEAVVDYYLDLIPGSGAASARDRLRLLSADDESSRPLAAKLLERPELIAELRAEIGDLGPAFILPYNVGESERDLALELRLPIMGPDPGLYRYGTKCGSRELFAAEGVHHPAGRERVADVAGLTAGIVAIRSARPHTQAVVVKLNDRVYGEGNRTLSLAGLPAPGDPGEHAAVEKRVRSLPDDYLSDLASDPGIVEELIDAHETRSPSVVFRILADGTPGLVYTQDQLLGGDSGQRFVGSSFPADAEYAGLIAHAGEKVRDRLVRDGMVGRFGIDFVVARDADGGDWLPYAVEINLREGGTSHPFGALYLLTDGEYEATRGTYLTASGEERYYVASDDLGEPSLAGTPIQRLLERARDDRLQYDRKSEVGCVFHMLRTLPTDGKCGVTAIGGSRAEADTLYTQVQELMAALAADQAAGSPR